MTPTSQPFPRALFHPSRCAAPLRGRLPQRTGKGLRASSGEVVRLYRGQPNTTMPHKTLPLSSLDQNVPNMPGIVQTTPSQKPSSSQRTILFEFDKTCVFGRKVQSRGFHLKLIRLPVQNTRPPHLKRGSYVVCRGGSANGSWSMGTTASLCTLSRSMILVDYWSWIGSDPGTSR